MKSIFILGAGLMQKPAIEAAHQLGYKVVVADGNPAAPCREDADTFVHIDLKDREGLLQYAESMKDELAAIFTAGTDFSASVSFVAERLGFPAHSFEAACNASDKIRMRRCFKVGNAPSPAFCEVTEADAAAPETLPEKAGLSFPLVIKPVDNMGGRGCRLLRSKEELVSAVPDALRYSRSGRAILEEYMDGPEFSIDALVYNGEIIITGFADRHIYFPPYFIEMGHTMPADISEKDWNVLAEAFAKGIRSLGLTHGVAKADIKLTSKGPMIGEIAARLSGGYMSGWTYPYSSDVFLTKQALLLALGEEPSEVMKKRVPTGKNGIWNLPSVRTSAERAWLSIPGKIAAVYGLSEAVAVSGVRDVLPRVTDGADVSFPLNNVEKCGNIIAVASSRSAAADAAETAASRIILRLEPSSPVTDAFLAAPLSEVFPPSAFYAPELEEKLGLISDSTLFFPADAASVSGWLEPYIDSIKDWNHRTIAVTLEQFNTCIPNCPELPVKGFFRALFRGGIQGILYFADTYLEKK